MSKRGVACGPYGGMIRIISTVEAYDAIRSSLGQDSRASPSTTGPALTLSTTSRCGRSPGRSPGLTPTSLDRAGPAVTDVPATVTSE